MPHKGESASFFSLHFLLQCSGRYPPFLPLPSSPLTGALPHCFAGRVGPEKFPRRSPNFVLPAKPRGRRPGTAPGSGRAAGVSPAPARAELAGRTRAPGAAEAAAPCPSVARCPRPAGEEEEAPWRPRPGNGCRDLQRPAALSCRGPSERAGSGRTEGAPRRPARRAAAGSPARPPSTFVPRSSRAQKSAGARAPRGSAPAVRWSGVHRQGQRTLQGERKSV